MLSELATPYIRCCLSAIPSDLMKSTVVDESLSSMNQQFCPRENQLLQYVCLCPECQKVTIKEPQYINLQLPIPQFSMSVISMDLFTAHRETEKGNQYALTIICMSINYVFMILIRSKSTEEVI